MLDVRLIEMIAGSSCPVQQAFAQLKPSKPLQLVLPKDDMGGAMVSVRGVWADDDGKLLYPHTIESTKIFCYKEDSECIDAHADVSVQIAGLAGRGAVVDAVVPDSDRYHIERWTSVEIVATEIAGCTRRVLTLNFFSGLFLKQQAIAGTFCQGEPVEEPRTLYSFPTLFIVQ